MSHNERKRPAKARAGSGNGNAWVGADARQNRF